MSSRELVLGALVSVAAACGDVAEPRAVVCGTSPIEVLANGSFDAATPPWAQDPASPALLCGAPRITPVDGTSAACLGGTDGTTHTLTQSISLPAGVKTLTLSGQICIDTLETDKVDADIVSFDVLSGDASVAAVGKQTNQQGKDPCVFAPFELTGTATSDPVTATFRIRSTLNNAKTTSFYIDKLSLKAACQ